MKKRFAAFITAIFLLFSVTVFADFYPDNVIRSELTFSEMLEYDFDYEAALVKLDETEALIKAGAPITKILESMDEALPPHGIDYKTRNDLNYIVSSLDNSEENNAIYYESSNHLVDIQQKFSNIVKMLYYSKHRDDLLVLMDMNEKEMTEYIDSIPTDEEYAMQKELNKLSETYYNSMFGSHKIEIDGEYYDFNQLLEADPEIIRNNLLRYFRESTNVLAPLFLKMVYKRNELAKAAGYKNYMEYAYSEIYEKDYTASDRKAFYNYTAEYIVPLFTELDEMNRIVYQGYEYREIRLSEEEIIKLTRESLERINPELTEAYDYMIDYELYDIGNSPTKRTGGFTTELEYFEVPFMFINPENSQSHMYETLIHEYGHFNASFHTPYITDPEYHSEYGMNLDIAEIHSQGMEMLFMDEIGRVYGSDAPVIRNENLIYMLDSVIAGSLYSMWLEEVYTSAESNNLAINDLNEMFIDCCKKLGVEDLYLYTDIGCEWIMVPHNFEVPFYYISYGVSAMTALEIFSDIQEDRSAGIEKYMRLTAKGEYVPFKKTIEECGYSNIFAESTFNDVVSTVSSYTGLLYDDISYEDWYYPYVIRTNRFVGPESGNKFEPQKSATRLTFVDALGKMEEDVFGIEAADSNFSDTDSKYVAWAAGEGIVAGISDTEFGAQQPVTREQIICFLYRMAGEPEVSGIPKFADRNEISPWASNAIFWAQSEGIASGYTDNTFRPKNNVTRGEAAKFLADAYETYY